jgi:tetratricopeptide (TPR) repeat protein
MIEYRLEIIEARESTERRVYSASNGVIARIAVAMRISGRTRFAVAISVLLPVILAKRAAAQTVSASDLRPEDAAVFQSALAAQQDRDLPTAERDYQTLLSTSPEFLPARFNLGLVLDAEGRTADALDAFEAVQAIEPAFSAVQMFVGIENFRSGRLEAAQTALGLATQQSPDDLHSWFWLARVDFAAGKTAHGKAALDKALAISPDDASSLNLLAQYLISAQDLTGAERILLGLESRYPLVPDFHESLGSVYYLEARLDKAEEEYRTELGLDASNPQALSMLGVILLDRGQAKQAVPYLAKGLDANPRIAYLQRKMGQALLESGETEEAIAHLREATALDAQEATAHFLLWKAYNLLSRKTEAAAELDAFRKLQSETHTVAGTPATSALEGGRP